MRLYEIDAKMQELMEKWEACIDQDTGEIMDDAVFDIEEELNKLQLNRNEKIENCACYYKGLLAEVTALKAEEQALEKRRKTAENRAQSLKNFIAHATGGQKYKSPRVSISHRRTPSVIVNDMEALIEFDDSLVRYADPEPRKAEIKKLLKAKDVPGCELVYNTSTIIK
ncbi:MAG: siphovirus Gp157 family protein [Lachnospiraceae bacterium]